LNLGFFRGSAGLERTNVLLKDMLQALEYLDQQNIIHRDVKPDNILYDRDLDQPRYQLADFGLSKVVEEGPGSDCGTGIYRAPEIGSTRPVAPHTTKVDVWSLAVTILCLLQVDDIEEETVRWRAIERVQHITQRPEFKLLRGMTESDPLVRASAGEVLRLGWRGDDHNKSHPRVADNAAGPVAHKNGTSRLLHGQTRYDAAETQSQQINEDSDVVMRDASYAEPDHVQNSRRPANKGKNAIFDYSEERRLSDSHGAEKPATRAWHGSNKQTLEGHRQQLPGTPKPPGSRSRSSGLGMGASGGHASGSTRK